MLTVAATQSERFDADAVSQVAMPQSHLRGFATG
jgi:hypothetical protein